MVFHCRLLWSLGKSPSEWNLNSNDFPINFWVWAIPYSPPQLGLVLALTQNPNSNEALSFNQVAVLICEGMLCIKSHYPPAKRRSRLLQHSPSVHRLSWLIDRPLSEVRTSQSFDLQELLEWEQNLISIEPVNQICRTINSRNLPHFKADVDARQITAVVTRSCKNKTWLCY